MSADIVRLFAPLSCFLGEFSRLDLSNVIQVNVLIHHLVPCEYMTMRANIDTEKGKVRHGVENFLNKISINRVNQVDSSWVCRCRFHLELSLRG
jgi:hypothetical protein